MRQRHRGAGGCWRLAGARLQDRAQFRVLGPPGLAEEADLQLRVELQLLAAARLELGGDLEGRVGRPGCIGLAPPPLRTPAVAPLRQLVPLRVNSLRLTLRKIERMSSLVPPKTSGIAVGPGVDLRGFGVEEEAAPGRRRCRGRTDPASAGVTTSERERRALVAPGEVGVALDLQRRVAGAGLALWRRRSCCRPGSAAFFFSAAPERSSASAIAVGGQYGTPFSFAVAPSGRVMSMPFQLLLARRAGDVGREGGEGFRLVAFRLRAEAGGEGALRHRFRAGAAARRFGEVNSLDGVAGGVARPRRQLAGRSCSARRSAGCSGPPSARRRC